jgi:hypothetical protein
VTLADELTTTVYASEYFRSLFRQLEMTVAVQFWNGGAANAECTDERRAFLMRRCPKLGIPRTE